MLSYLKVRRLPWMCHLSGYPADGDATDGVHHPGYLDVRHSMLGGASGATLVRARVRARSGSTRMPTHHGVPSRHGTQDEVHRQ